MVSVFFRDAQYGTCRNFGCYVTRLGKGNWQQVQSTTTQFFQRLLKMMSQCFQSQVLSAKSIIVTVTVLIINIIIIIALLWARIV